MKLKFIVLIFCFTYLSAILKAQECDTTLNLYTPSDDFTVLENPALVRHNKTTLIWQRCSVNQKWVDGQCKGEAKLYTYEEALALAESNQDFDYNDWQLPTIKQLATIIELACIEPAINTVIFPNTNQKYWSSTPYFDNKNSAWQLNYKKGHDSGNLRTQKNYVRLVRFE